MRGNFFRNSVSALLDLFYPNPCLLCRNMLQKQEEIICTACRLKLPETGMHRGQTLQAMALRLAGKVPVAFILSFLYFTKKGKSQRLIHALKYEGHKEVGLVLGHWYGHQLRSESDIVSQVDVIVAVPLHPAKLRQRGYNQSAWFAAGLSETLEKPWEENLLIRTSYTVSQTGKDRMERWENVSQVFQVNQPQLLSGKRALLVDDVLTTGATLEACINALLAAGCRSVGIVTIAATR